MLFRTVSAKWAAVLVTLSIALSIVPLAATSQESYPSKRFTFVVPYGAGSATDAFSRIVADGLSRHSGQAVIVTNKPGANGMIAVRSVQSSPADGYTFVILANGIVIEQVLRRRADFDIRKDLIPVARVSQAPLGMFVSNSLPVHSVKEFIDYAKKNPGKINYGSAAVGSIVQLTTERFKLAAGLNLVHVPYPGGTGPQLTAMIAGDLGLMINEMGSMKSMVTAGKIKILATLGDKRSPIYPDAPSVPELGIAELKDAFAPFFYGIFVAPGTDAAIVETLATQINGALADATTRERLAGLGYDSALLGGTRPADFRRAVDAEIARVEATVRDAKIKLE